MARAGYREWVHLPDLDLGPIIAKLDTGARTSALHAADLHTHARHGRPVVTFRVPSGRDGKGGRRHTVPLLGHRWVRDSGGHGTWRPLILLRIHVGNEAFDVEATLAERGGMRHRFLLGRQAMKGRFVVDPEASFICGPPGVRVPIAP